MRLEDFTQAFGYLTDQVESLVYGKRDKVRRALLCLLAGGHLLLDDVPGVGKTTLARALAMVIEDGTVSRIQGTPDLLPSDIVGMSVFERDSGRFTFRPGPVVANIVLFDEINRCAPRTQSALLEAMQERRITAFRHEQELPDPFLVIGTQNPQETLGTYPLPEAQLDRFLLRLSLGYPDRDAARAMLKSHGRRPAASTPRPGVPIARLRAMAEYAADVEVSDQVYDYLLDVVDATRTHPEIAQGASPRAGADLLRAARVNAVLNAEGDQPFLRPDDIREIAVDVLAHRIVLADRSTRGSSAAECELVKRVVEQVPVPQRTIRQAVRAARFLR